MSVFRQLAVHNFSLAAGMPKEMGDEILAFCFYDTITAACRAIHQANMGDIVARFTSAWISRANTPEMHDDREHWAIHLVALDQEEDNEAQFQATNCRVCGNYKMCCTFEPQIETDAFLVLDETELVALCLEAIPPHIRCHCH